MYVHEFILIVGSVDLGEVLEYVRGEEIGSSIDDAAHKSLWLFYIVQHLGRERPTVF